VDKLGEEKSEILLETLEQVCEYLDEVHVEGWEY
jgi:DNA-binding Xre family transcriptional regulator